MPRPAFHARLRLLAAMLSALLVLATASAAVAVAVAGVSAKPHSSFVATVFGSFSLALDTRAANQIVAGPPTTRETEPRISGIVIVCPKVTPSEYVSELHVGFPGVRLRLLRGHGYFARTYTENVTKLLNFGTGAIDTVLGVRVSVTGTVANAKLIKGTLSVQAPRCGLKRSKYSAEYSGRLR